MPQSLFHLAIPSPIGELTLVAHDHALVAVLFKNDRLTPHYLTHSTPTSHHTVLNTTQDQLNEYFNGTRQAFDIKLNPDGTDFQKRVWTALCEIPYGQTQSYGGQAISIGAPKAARAVGAANGRNPIPVIIPCHRVIGTSGTLTGYAGGLATKAYLLAHEKRYAFPKAA